MRKITRQSAQALIDGNSFNSGNMAVMGDESNSIMTLHGNTIATREGNKVLLTDSGWLTATTKERLNGVLSLIGSKWRLYQHQGEWYITDGCGVRKNWNGSLSETI